MLLVGACIITLIMVASIAAVESKDPLVAVICFSIMGTGLAILYALLRAPDVAIAEAAIGAGLVTAFFIVTLNQINRVKVEKSDSTPHVKDEGRTDG